MIKKVIALSFLFCFLKVASAQHSIARLWNEKVLDAIRADFARPTIHARNLFHTSIAMYDAWAVYNGEADTYFLGKTVHGYPCSLQKIHMPVDTKAAQEEAISYAVYRLIKHRFALSPRAEILFEEVDAFMDSLGYNSENTSIDYACSSSGMGNYIAEQLIKYGLQDGSHEAAEYANFYYKPFNPPLVIIAPGNPDIIDLNRWQPLALMQFIDQGGNVTGSNAPEFLSPEWGQVSPFALQAENITIYERDGNDYMVCHDPGPPPYLNMLNNNDFSEEYRWGHSLVSIWSSHLDPTDGVLWDISPASIGNISNYPDNIFDFREFYNTIIGGDPSTGHAVNPKTGTPYEPQVVPRGDYARVLAEFWADGPDSETPPGHWFTILNYVNDHPDLVKKIKGEGPELTDLEWDVKSYFMLGGAMHDAAITAWGIKGWYDYIRPVSAIRGITELGQSTDPNLPSYHPGGIPLIPGYIELIEASDPLQGPDAFYVGEIKIKGWKGPTFIRDPETDVAGVAWIRAANWYPYQRPSFVTPPFAGYVSGHSTFSRAAAEVLTALTGDPFFPGGMGEFYCPKNEFLVFEDGPSVDVTLQWATYRDASDQCSLSRIWGGIHPPCDDIPGRLIGMKIGVDAFDFALQYFTKPEEPLFSKSLKIYPNPTNCAISIDYDIEGPVPIAIFQCDGKKVLQTELNFVNQQAMLLVEKLDRGVFFLVAYEKDGKHIFEEKVVIQ